MAIRGPVKYGGLNTKSNTTSFTSGNTPSGNWMDTPAGHMTICNDFNLLYGALIPRPATRKYFNQVSANPILGMTSWIDSVNITQGRRVFAVANGKLYSSPWNVATPATMTDVTGTAVIGTAASSKYKFVSLNNILVGTGGSGEGISAVPFQITVYNGTASSLPGSAPGADAIKVVNNIMFLSRQLALTVVGSRVNWSDVGDPTVWGVNNYVDFRKNDGDRVTALGSIGTDLYIFKSASIGRLSTTTLIVSGAVSLGPLETLFLGVGALNPSCVDNLPDGRIVFLGSDARLYVLDGFVLTDLSDNSSPKSNILPSIEEMLVNSPARVFLKVYPTHHQIIIGCGLGTIANRLYAYDYQNDFWSAWTGLTPHDLMTIISTDVQVNSSAGSFFDASYSLFEGTEAGTIFQLDLESSLFGPGNESGGNLTATCTINVPLTGDFYDFIPRSLLLPIGNGGTTFSGIANGLIVTFGWDGTFLTNASFTMVGGTTYPNTLVIPIPITKEGSTTVRPMSLQIKIQVANGGPILHPFYLSDEVSN